MSLDICKERRNLRSQLGYYVNRYGNDAIERLAELNRLWKELAVERIPIHRSLYDYVTDCPALENSRKLFPTTDVYGRYGCEGCAYYYDEFLQYVRCKWRAAQGTGTNGRKGPVPL